MSGYTHPEVLVSTQWIADHLNDSNVHLLEVGAVGYPPICGLL